jgi:hypothetical protein
MKSLLDPWQSDPGDPGVPVVPGAVTGQHEIEFAIPSYGISTRLTSLKIFEYFEMAS